MKWEMFLDEWYFHLWCVRPVGDRDFNSPNSRHFVRREDAQNFLNKMNGVEK